MRTEPNLIITEADERKLRALLSRADEFSERDQIPWRMLEGELDRARVVASHDIPANIVRMNSRVRIIDMRTGEQLVYKIVYPDEANYAEKKISVLAPIGMALLGCSEGTEIEWAVPSGTRRLRIEGVEQQPKEVPIKAVA
jgi:regulator of nucleoside diphosphate kinase